MQQRRLIAIINNFRIHMNSIQKKMALAGLLVIGLMIGSQVSFVSADTTPIEYKQSFSAIINGPQEVPPTTSDMTGDATFNVRMDERFIDYTVHTSTNSGITGLVLGCARPGVNGTTVVSLGNTFSGTITEDMLILPDAFVCSPNIHTMPHLVQAMREGAIYINVLTNAFPAGEIRGQLGDGILPNPANPGTTTNATSTNPTGGTGTTTSTTTNPIGGIATSTSPTGGTGTTTNATSTPSTGGSNGGGGAGIAPSTNGGGSGSTSNGGGVGSTGTTTSTGGVGSNTSSGIGSGSQGQILGAFTDRACTYLTGYIKPGVANDPYNVALLQIFLNKNMNAGLTLNGHYDTASIAAVNAFQLAHADQILAPWVAYGLPTGTTTTGYVYKTTKWSIDNIACGTNTPMPQLP